MSGICGIFRLDDAPPEGIRAMVAHLERRGPDGSHVFQSGPVALGHTALNTTPESLHEALPFTHPGSGCTITADLRLDNRETLITAFGLQNAGRVIGDAELVLMAYLKWGEDCPAHLLGDFAFAISDPRKGRLFCARDQMGMKQLIWHRTEGRIFAFASEPKAVLLARGVPGQINDARIADFLEGVLEGADFTSTFFTGISRLPPAHCLTVSRDHFSLRRYWVMEAGPELKLARDEEYGEALLEVFSTSVGARLRCHGPVGSMLSGGMDSGSIVAVAAGLLAKAGRGPLHSFSCIGPDPATCIETRAALATLRHVPGIAAHTLSYDQLAPWSEDLIRLTCQDGEPFDSHMTLVRSAWLMAKQAGVRVVMDGVGGDCVLPSVSRAARELRRGNIRQAWRESAGAAAFWNSTALPEFLRNMREAFTPQLLRRLRDHLQLHRGDLPRRRLLSPELARRVALDNRYRTLASHSQTGLKPKNLQHLTALLHPYMTVGRERYDRVAAGMGIEPRDPFLDRRMVNFCLTLPARQIDHDGWIKMVLRRAMAGLLPDEVRWRRGKQHLGGHFTAQMLQDWPGWRDRAKLQQHSDGLREHNYTRPNAPGHAGQDGANLLTVHEELELLFLALWLDGLSDLTGATGKFRDE